MDQQRWMDILVNRNDPSVVLNAVIGDYTNEDSEDDTHEQVLSEFMKENFKDIGKPHGTHEPLPNCLLKPDPLLAMPPEAYRKRLTKLRRRKFFFQQLYRRDLLYLQVINICKESYKCLVLAKHGDLQQLDDLSIVAHFPRLHPELNILGANLQKFDLIRGAFWACLPWVRHLFVTVDNRIFTKEEKEKIPKLGKISRSDLPYYVRSLKIGMTYAGYVQRSKGYKEENYCMKQLNESFGIDTNRIYSFFKEWDGKTYPATEHYNELKKKLIPDSSTQRLLKSFDYFRAGNMYKALYYANKAIAFNPDNIQARVTRGTVYANIGKMKKAFVDTLDSLKLDWQHEAASKQMAELLVAASKTFLFKRNYFKWHEYLVMAKKYNANNREAQELLSCAKFATPANGVPAPIQPAMGRVNAIYRRLFDEADKRRRLKHYRKQRKRKRKQHRRRRRTARQRARQSMVPQQIPTTTTSRRQVFRSRGRLSSGYQVFRS